MRVVAKFNPSLQGVGFEFPDKPDARGDKKNHERAEQEKRGWQAGKVGGDFENERAGGNECQQQHREHRQQRSRQRRERDGQQIHEQNERPDHKRNFGQFENRHEYQHEREYREEVICPILPGCAVLALKPRGQSRMKNRENEIKHQTGVKQFIRQGFRGPEGEQSEHGNAGDRPGGGDCLIKPGDGDGNQVHQENETEQEPRTLRQWRKIEEPGGKCQGNRDQAERRAGQPLVDLAATFRQPVCHEPERVESQQHGEPYEDFVTGEILFADEKPARPANLQDGCPERSQRGEKMPAAYQRNRDHPGVENRDVTEQTQRIVLAGRKQNRSEETTQHPEDGDNQCVQPDRQQEGRCRDERHQQKGWQRAKKIKMVNRTAGKGNGV